MKNDGILLFGSTGLLGAHVLAILQASKIHQRVIGIGSGAVNFKDVGTAGRFIKTIRPSVVINCAAWTDVDGCESNRVLADAINAQAPHEMAMACRDTGARFVHVSTDFVYSGSESTMPPFREVDPPENFVGRDIGGVYAKTKHAGECFVPMAPDHCIIRTSWLFGNHPRGKKTFPEWFVDSTLATIQQMRSFASTGESYQRTPLLIDRFGSPSYAPDVAQALLFLAASPYIGPAHLVNGVPSDVRTPAAQKANGFTGSQEDFGSYALREFANSSPIKNGLLEEVGRDFDSIFFRQKQADLIEAGTWKVARPTDTRLMPSCLGGFEMRPYDLALRHFWMNRRVAL